MAGVTRLGRGAYLVDHDGRHDVVYVAGTTGNRWAFWNGRVFHDRGDEALPLHRGAAGTGAAQALSAPMPATIVRVLVAPGAAVRKGDVVVVAEAMKMELPIRALADAVVTAVRCREGDIVQPDQVLIELT
jgi:biotin carboxyl carrier protein